MGNCLAKQSCHYKSDLTPIQTLSDWQFKQYPFVLCTDSENIFLSKSKNDDRNQKIALNVPDTSSNAFLYLSVTDRCGVLTWHDLLLAGDRRKQLAV